MVTDRFNKIGGVWPLSIPVSQAWNDLGIIFTAIHETGCKSFIELGLQAGGLASLLTARTMLDNFHYLGVEININSVDDRVKSFVSLSHRSHILYGDVFSLKIISSIGASMLSMPKPLIAYCDNGNKPKELEIYSRLIDVGDFIMVHDLGREIMESDLSKYPFLKRWETDWLQNSRIAFLEKVY